MLGNPINLLIVLNILSILPKKLNKIPWRKGRPKIKFNLLHPSFNPDKVNKDYLTI